MASDSIRHKYFELVQAHFDAPHEGYLLAAADLGQELVQADVPPDEIGEMHEEALRRLAAQHPQLSLVDSVRLCSAPLMEMLMSYGLVFRKRLEQLERTADQLRQREERLAEAQQIAHLGSWSRDIVTGEATWSDECYRIFGYIPGEITPSFKLVQDAIHSDDREWAKNIADEVLTNGGSFDQEFRIFRPDGAERMLRSRAVAHTDDKGGKVLRLVGTVLDITERKRAESLIHAIHLTGTRYMVGASAYELFKQLLDTLLSLTDSEYGFVGEVFLDVTGQPFLTVRAITNIAWDEETQARYDRVEHGGVEFHDLKTLFGAVMTTGKPVIANDPSNDARRAGTLPGHPPLRSFLGIPFGPGERVTGMVGMANRPGGYNEAMIEYLQPLIAQCESVTAAYRSNEQRKRLEREILDISVREQRRIGQDLHDGLGQRLTGIAFLSKALAQKLAAKSWPDAADAAEIEKLINATIEQARHLAKGLHPTALVTGGLQVALEELASTTEQLFDVSCVLTADRAASLPDDVATQLYYMAQEAVTNAVKHGKAGNITLALRATGDTTTLAVEDDGMGFPADGERAQGMGLHIMRYRAGIIDGSLDIRRRPDGGTVVLCSFPTPATEEGESKADVRESNET